MPNELSSLLIIEDNHDDYEATLRSFKKNHFMNPVAWCKNGKDAFDYLTRSGKYENDASVLTPSFILLDLNMPGMDGRNLLDKIKHHPTLNRIPVIILTTSADQNDIEKCYDLGASTYIQKPVSLDGLTKAIATMKDYWFGVAILPK